MTVTDRLRINDLILLLSNTDRPLLRYMHVFRILQNVLEKFVSEILHVLNKYTFNRTPLLMPLYSCRKAMTCLCIKVYLKLKKFLFTYQTISNQIMINRTTPKGHTLSGAYPGISEGGGGGVPRPAKEANKQNKRTTELKPLTCAHQGSMFRPY